MCTMDKQTKYAQIHNVFCFGLDDELDFVLVFTSDDEHMTKLVWC